MRDLSVRQKHIGTSSPVEREFKSNESYVHLNLLLWNHSAGFDDFSIRKHENKMLLLELNVNLLIMRDQAPLKRKISPTTLHQLNRP